MHENVERWKCEQSEKGRGQQTAHHHDGQRPLDLCPMQSQHQQGQQAENRGGSRHYLGPNSPNAGFLDCIFKGLAFGQKGPRLRYQGRDRSARQSRTNRLVPLVRTRSTSHLPEAARRFRL